VGLLSIIDILYLAVIFRVVQSGGGAKRRSATNPPKKWRPTC